MIEADEGDALAVPDWFWDVIEAAKPRVAALEAWLAAQPEATMAQFALIYETAAAELADYWDGIEVDGDVWSEDDMEDLCDWVVSQGRDYWTSVRTGDRPLIEAARTYRAESGTWDPAITNPEHRGYASPQAIVHGVYWSRFGESLDDRLDVLDQLG